MANRNGTGPDGKGSKTGRQMGNCEGAEPMNQGSSRYRSCGCGRDRWFRRQAQVED